jgi:hypothetical protein
VNPACGASRLNLKSAIAEARMNNHPDAMHRSPQSCFQHDCLKAARMHRILV